MPTTTRCWFRSTRDNWTCTGWTATTTDTCQAQSRRTLTWANLSQEANKKFVSSQCARSDQGTTVCTLRSNPLNPSASHFSYHSYVQLASPSPLCSQNRRLCRSLIWVCAKTKWQARSCSSTHQNPNSAKWAHQRSCTISSTRAVKSQQQVCTD
jgi:hypothetical protein